MEIIFRTKKIEKICTNASEAKKNYSFDMVRKIIFRIQEIKSAENVEEMIKYRLGRCHKLRGNRDGQYAVDLVHPYRLIFTIQGEVIEIACIEEIVDYH